MRGLFLYLALSFCLDADKVSIDESAVEKQRARKQKQKILVDFVVASELKEVAVLGSPSLTVRTVSVDVKQL